MADPYYLGGRDNGSGGRLYGFLRDFGYSTVLWYVYQAFVDPGACSVARRGFQRHRGGGER